MNKKNNRKGFTIVELVIVIAVIALLATILVPTFENVVGKAKNAALVAEIKNAHADYVIQNAENEGYSDTVYIKIDGEFYLVEKGEIDMANENEPDQSNEPQIDNVVFCAECRCVANGEVNHNEANESTVINWECACSEEG